MTPTFRRRSLLGAAAGLAVPLAPAFAPRAARAQGAPLKAAWMYVGPVGDLGWSHQHDQSRLAVQRHFGGRVQTGFVENVAEGPDAERVLRSLAQAGNDLIFSTSFGFMNPCERVARQFPRVKFEQATGYKTLPNMAEYNARFYEGRAVCGAIAGHVSRAGVVGYIASFPIPEVVMGINAFTLAARRVNPRLQTKVVWLNSWFDPGKEADAAKALLDQGADILAQHTDSPAPMQVAESRGANAFGQSTDMSRFGPRAHLTAVVNDWAPYCIGRVQAALDGTWATGSIWWGMKEGMVVIPPYGPSVTPPAAAEADRVKAGIVAGTLHPFAGPVRDQKGTVRIAEGAAISDEDLLKMNWYVEGVQA